MQWGSDAHIPFTISKNLRVNIYIIDIKNQNIITNRQTDKENLQSFFYQNTD